MKITSSAFEENTRIPNQYTCDADQQVSPPLKFEDVPENAETLALIVDDPDVPEQVVPAGEFVHWVLFNISKETDGIPENSFAGTRGANGAGKQEYTGPCPPPQYEPKEHRYFFKLYALDTVLDLSEGATKQQLLDAMDGHILEEAQLMARYQRAS